VLYIPLLEDIASQNASMFTNSKLDWTGDKKVQGYYCFGR